MTTRDRPEAPEEAPQGAATKTRSRLPMIGGTVAVLALSVLGLSQCGWVQKVKLDREVDRLCAIDGGVHIYETVMLPKEDFGPDGGVFPQYRHLSLQGSHLGPDFQELIERQVIVAGNPELVRSTVRIVRRSDSKTLAEQINYVRGGGDPVGPWATSTHQCHQVLKAAKSLSSVFTKE